jgi:hypothetical protein
MTVVIGGGAGIGSMRDAWLLTWKGARAPCQLSRDAARGEV